MLPEDYEECIRAYQYMADPAPSAAWEKYDLVSHGAAADCIARTAYFLGKDAAHDSPFARSAASYGKRYAGGKHDDITVTVAQVRAAPPAATGVREEAKEHKRLSLDDRIVPYRNAPVYVYQESDWPIPPVDQLPTMDQILEVFSLHSEL